MRHRKHIVTGLRLAACAAALWFVVRGVAMDDALVLRNGAVLAGRVEFSGSGLLVAGGDGARQVVAREDVALDERGAPRVSYGLRSVWDRNGKGLLAAGIAVWVSVTFLQAARLKWLLASQRIEMGWWASIRLAFAGNFLNYAAPLGSTAGDVYKVYTATRQTSRKAEAATTVLVDRAIGLGTLLLSVGCVVALAGPESRLAAMRAYVLVPRFAVLLGVALYMLPAVRRSARLRRIVAQLPHAETMRRADSAVRGLLGTPRVLLTAVSVTFVLQVLCAVSFALVALSLGLRVEQAGALDTFAQFSAGEIVKALPGPPQGLGTMELAYQYFFGELGSASQVVSAAFAMRLIGLLCALPGLAVVVASGAIRRTAVAQSSATPALAA